MFITFLSSSYRNYFSFQYKGRSDIYLCKLWVTLLQSYSFLYSLLHWSLLIVIRNYVCMNERERRARGRGRGRGREWYWRRMNEKESEVRKSTVIDSENDAEIFVSSLWLPNVLKKLKIKRKQLENWMRAMDFLHPQGNRFLLSLN